MPNAERPGQGAKNEFGQRLYAWTLSLIRTIQGFPKDFISETMGKQLVRSGTSVLANYTEAKSASSRKDFINFFTHALKSANESGVWLRLLEDTGRLPAAKGGGLRGELAEIANILASSIITMKKK